MTSALAPPRALQAERLVQATGRSPGLSCERPTTMKSTRRHVSRARRSREPRIPRGLLGRVLAEDALDADLHLGAQQAHQTLGLRRGRADLEGQLLAHAFEHLGPDGDQPAGDGGAWDPALHPRAIE